MSIQHSSPVQYIPLPARAVLEVGGGDAREFLQGLVSNDVRKVSPSHAIYAALLSPQGKFLHDMFIVQRDNAYWLDCEKSRMDDLTARLSRYKLRAQVVISPRPEYGIWAALDSILPQTRLPQEREQVVSEGGGISYADPRHPDMGVRMIVREDTSFLAQKETAISPWEIYEAHRLQLGMPDGSRDIIADKMFLIEAGFDDLHGVDFTKGCYVGQEVTARSKHRGGVRKFLFQVTAQQALPPAGTVLLCDGKEVGEMRSSLGTHGIALLRTEGWQAWRAGMPLLADNIALMPSLPKWSHVTLD